MAASNHNEKVKVAFRQQAGRYNEIERPATRKEVLDWCLNALPISKQDKVLDLATGTGILACGLAPKCKEVIGVDVSSEMLTEARTASRMSGFTNIIFQEASGDALPYKDGEFSLVASRLAFHHFPIPQKQFTEMCRVCTTHGSIGVIDLVAPNSTEEARAFDELERLRDASHTHLLSSHDFHNLFQTAGLATPTVTTRDFEMALTNYLAVTGSDDSVASAFRTQFAEELNGGKKTGFRPFRHDDEFFFKLTFGVFVSRKSSMAETP